jgi:ABC-type transport system involved in cytochrome bd biosynthesis fused ATPase/permease subunit
MEWDLVSTIILLVVVPLIPFLLILYIWFQKKKEKENIPDKWERLEKEIKEKLE